MKRITALLFALLLLAGLTACGGKKAVTMDLDALYQTLEEKLPLMMELDEAARLNYMGLQAADCEKAIVAICGEGLRADEVWLIQAKDAAALARIQELGQIRMTAKAEESESYDPEQYQIIKQGVTLTEGLYYVLLVSPEVEAMKAAFQQAAK